MYAAASGGNDSVMQRVQAHMLLAYLWHGHLLFAWQL